MYNFLAFCDAVLCVFQTVNYLSKEERGSYFASVIIGCVCGMSSCIFLGVTCRGIATNYAKTHLRTYLNRKYGTILPQF